MALAQDYPPRRHVHRDLLLALEHGDERSAGWLPATEAVLTPAGHVRAGVVAILVDVTAAALAVRTVRPDWVATADLSLHLLDPPAVAVGAEIEARARITRRGRTTVVCELDLIDPDGALLGVASTTFAVLPARRDQSVGQHDDAPLPRTSLALEGSGLRRPVLDEFGITVTDAAGGRVELPVTDFVRNSLGTLQGGVAATAIDVAASQAIGAACGVPVETVDLQVTYVQAAKAAVSTRAEMLLTAPFGGSARVEVLDGDSGELTAVGRVTAAIPEARP